MVLRFVVRATGHCATGAPAAEGAMRAERGTRPVDSAREGLGEGQELPQSRSDLVRRVMTQKP